MADGDVVVNIDRSQNGSNAEFLGRFVTGQLKSLVNGRTPVYVNQLQSEESQGLQMADAASMGNFPEMRGEGCRVGIACTKIATLQIMLITFA